MASRFYFHEHKTGLLTILTFITNMDHHIGPVSKKENNVNKYHQINLLKKLDIFWCKLF